MFFRVSDGAEFAACVSDGAFSCWVGKTWHASCARIPRPRVALAHPTRFCMSYSVPRCVSRLPGVSWGPWARAPKGSPTVHLRSSCKVQRVVQLVSCVPWPLPLRPRLFPIILWLRGLTVAASPEGEPRVHRGGPTAFRALPQERTRGGPRVARWVAMGVPVRLHHCVRLAAHQVARRTALLPPIFA